MPPKAANAGPLDLKMSRAEEVSAGRTDILLGAPKHDALEQAAQGHQALGTHLALAQHQAAPAPVVIEGFTRQKLQQPLRPAISPFFSKIVII